MKSPFKFLDSYTREDRNIFFGRDREIEELYHRVFESKIMLVYGVSGTGKSSLIHCGLANKFQDTDWLPIVVRRGGNIIETLAAGINAASITQKYSDLNTPAMFRKAVRSLYLDHYKPVFFIFDQFEELFIFGTKEERKAFIQGVKLLTESDLQCRMIFVMREEYMAGVTEFEKYIPTFFSNRVRIEKMSHLNATIAIEKSCSAAAIILEDGFSEALLSKLSPEEKDVELTYLQVYLDKIFRIAQAENDNSILFTIKMLDAAGNVSDLLGSFLDEQISKLDDAEAGLAVLKTFVSEQGTKQQMTLSDAVEYLAILGQSISEKVVSNLVLIFVKLRILCDKDQNGKYELRHDALAAKIFEKFTLAEKELLEVRKFIENAYYAFQRRNIYLTKTDLDYLSGYENKLILPVTLSGFISESREQISKQKLAMKRVTRITTFIFLLILLLTLRFYLSTRAKDNPSNLYKSALLQSANNPLSGLFAELNLWKKDSGSAELHGYILKDFQNLMNEKADSSDPLFDLQQKMKPLNLETAVMRAWITPEGNYIYGFLKNGDVFTNQLADGNIRRFKTNSLPLNIILSEKRSLIAIVFVNGEVMVSDFNGKKLFSCSTKLNDKMNDKLICFFPYGKKLLACANGESILIYDNSGAIVEELPVQTGNINSIDVSPNGLYVVSVADKIGYIWHTDAGSEKFSLFHTLSGHYGEIWSCRFNKTGKYIITASADSSIRIWNLNGTHINSNFNFDLGDRRFKLNNREPDEDRSNPYYARYYGKFCDAEFSKSELEIIATGYNETDPSGRLINYFKVLFFDGIGGFPYSHERINFIPGSRGYSTRQMEFDDFVLSPNNTFGAVVDSTASNIYVISGLNYAVLKLKGNNPFFDSKGNYLYWLNENNIMKMPVDPAEIRKLSAPLADYKAFENDDLLVF